MSRFDRFLFSLAGFAALVFVTAYPVAAGLYPGGSPFDRATIGYDYADNYLCDAFRARAYNGAPNELGARIGQIGMLALVVAAATVLFASPVVFRDEHPKVSRLARVVALVAFAGMLLVPLTPAHEYGRLHFAAIGIAAVPSLVAAYLVAFGLSRVARGDDRASAALRWTSLLTLVAVTVHFGQYAAQVSGVLGESPWVPRSQKPVVLIVLAWIATIVVWIRLRDDDRISGERLARAETMPPDDAP